jgi:diaminopimelate decarboxylase
MHSFQYKEGVLHCENVSLAEVASEAGTPCYVYSAETIVDHYRRLDAGLSAINHVICYAVKANSNIAVLNLLAKEGAGFDIVSGGELFRVIKAGGNPSLCTFAGVGKTEDEIRYALMNQILGFNVESESELRTINRVAREMNVRAPIALRVNPDVEASTHKYISTGKSENKFGIDFDRILDAYEEAAAMSNVRIRGLQMHIGSQITTVSPFEEAVRKVAPLALKLQALYGIEYLSIGGGIGIIYDSALVSGDGSWWETESRDTLTIERYAAAVVPILEELDLRILFEPGRYMVGNAGVLLTKTLYEKRTPTKTFMIADAGMNDLIRPALYEGFHEIVPVKQPTTDETEVMDLVGPICESGDFFAQGREVPKVGEGEVLALMSAGAYGFTMASNYNSRPMAAEVLVQGDKASVIRTRQTLEDLIQGESIPQ